MGEKKNLEFVKEQFSKAGCTLLATEYIGKDAHMPYLCSCGNEEVMVISWANFRKGRRCNKCGQEKRVAKRRLRFEDVRDYFKEHGCTLLETEYINVITKMRYICECDNEWKTSFSDFKLGKRCRKCRYEKAAKSQMLDKEFVFETIEKEGYKVLSDEYENNQTPLKAICPRGHEIEIIYSSFSQGYRCKYCEYDRRKGSGHYNWHENREEIALLKKIRNKCKTAIASALKATGHKKETRSSVLNGYKPHELKEHIINHPNWDAVKDKEWELDHIFPVTAFVDYGFVEIEHIKIINGLDNLQPLLGYENRHKYDKYNKQEFEAWLKSKGINVPLSPTSSCSPSLELDFQ